jgi:hypothetical protein
MQCLNTNIKHYNTTFILNVFETSSTIFVNQHNFYLKSELIHSGNPIVCGCTLSNLVTSSIPEKISLLCNYLLF